MPKLPTVRCKDTSVGRLSSVGCEQALVRDKLGLCQWFHFADHAAVDRTIECLAELNVKHLRTGISWADYFRPGGQAWYDWQMARLRESGLEVLLSIWHTPPSISEGGTCNSPPRRLRDYADFIDRVITEYGDSWHGLELWNEPNNRYKWDFEQFDPDWRKWAAMVGDAAYWAKQCGRKTILGGMIPVDHHWLQLIESHGVLQYIDVVAIHGFPEMWFPDHPNWEWYRDWNGWHGRLNYIAPYAGGRPIWITESGLATWDLNRNVEDRLPLQESKLLALAAAPAERVYFYSLFDLDPFREAIEGFHVDENEYHMGLYRHDGSAKPAAAAARELLRRIPATPNTGQSTRTP
jgi:CDP-paratose 2-epimerase